METCIRNWQPEDLFEENGENQRNQSQEEQGREQQGREQHNKERIKPWEQNREFLAEDVDGKLRLTLSNLIYVDTSNLKPRIQNRIRKMAAFANPVFYKKPGHGTIQFCKWQIYLSWTG